MSGANAELVELGDVDELVRHVGRLCAVSAWDELVDLRDRCRSALERGRQLWGVASLAEYRLALQAPGPWAGAVLVEGAGQRALGPLPEVAASTHTWEELGPHVPAGPLKAATAAERAVRGERLQDTEALQHSGVPLHLASWEPDDELAHYSPERLDAPRPALVPLGETDPGPAAEVIADVGGLDALRGLVTAWTAESNGRCEVVAVSGTGLGAVAALGVPRLRAAQVEPATAISHVAWAAASGGAHGRRRGAAAGRFEAWWLVATLGGVSEDWPIDEDALGEIASELRWWLWDAVEPDTGWHLRLAVEDPLDGMAWAISAIDAA